MARGQFRIVIVGHVDHGKSTVLGRLLADTGSLPEGKLEQVREMCLKNAKPFEYAFLLDALKDEQTQGITIDIARSFFKTKKRDYIVLDAPGHIEFLKNMITGAAHAEAALLVIDAAEGIQENSKRHGYLISMIGIKQVAVLVNKMDLVDYNKDVFERIKSEYSEFLANINVKPTNFIPISAKEGDNIVGDSEKMPWYSGVSILEQVDQFAKTPTLEKLPLRIPVQDIYKFTGGNDDRRIVAGTIETGTIKVGDDVVFWPSKKKTAIKSIESFNTDRKTTASAGAATGFTLTTQIYVRPGEIMTGEKDPPPCVSNRFKANIFWVGKAPMIKNKNYKLKLTTAKASLRLAEIINVIDATDLTSDKSKGQIDRHDVAEAVFETVKPIAFDLVEKSERTSRFVIIDNYEIAGGGIILEDLAEGFASLEKHIEKREDIWEKGSISQEDRMVAYNHKSKFIIFTGAKHVGKRKIAKALEQKLFKEKFKVYYLGTSNVRLGLEADILDKDSASDEHIRRLGELARLMTDSGQIFITTIDNTDEYDLQILKMLNEPNEILVINVGENNLNQSILNLILDKDEDIDRATDKVYQLLKDKSIILEYYI